MKRVIVLVLLLLLPPEKGFSAQDYYPPPWPDGNVTYTVPYNKGSESDALFALFRDGFAAATQRKLVPRYVPGQAGANAWALMVDDPPNGSVVTAVTLPNIFLRTFQPDSGVSPDSMAICHITAYMPAVLWTAGFSSFSSVQSFVEAARSMNGGLLVAGPGRFCAGQIASRALDRQAGVKTTYVPYVDSVAAAKAVLNRQASVFWAYSVPLSVFGTTFRPLAVAAGQRLPSMPNVPTFRELGFDVIEGEYHGVAVPRETPEETRKEIAAFFTQFAKSPEFQQKARDLGFTPLDIPVTALPAFLRQQQDIINRRVMEFELTVQ